MCRTRSGPQWACTNKMIKANEGAIGFAKHYIGGNYFAIMIICAILTQRRKATVPREKPH